ncbi:MAG: MBG domain-containing protein, partial [Verrucomicrobia bacterium]|nr:MBG domain-containing protein [Verrucomicrobiota bacterium]
MLPSRNVNHSGGLAAKNAESAKKERPAASPLHGSWTGKMSNELTRIESVNGCCLHVVPPSGGSDRLKPGLHASSWREPATPADVVMSGWLSEGLRPFFSFWLSLLIGCFAAMAMLLAHTCIAADQVNASSARYEISHRTLGVGGGQAQSGTLSFETSLGGFPGGSKTSDGRVTFELGRVGFLVADDPLNLAPTLSTVGNQNGDGGATPLVNFTVGDEETPVTELSVSGSSSNPALIPNSSIHLGGLDGNRTVQVFPLPGITGSAILTLTVSDTNGGQGSTQFTVTVNVPAQTVTPEMSWPNPAAIVYGTALGSTQLNAAASVPGTFAYSPVSGAILQALSVTFTPTDTTLYETVQTTVSITVNKAPLTITADSKSKVYGAALPALTASYSGFVNGETVAVLAAPISLSTTATASSNAGSYTITPAGASAANYTISFVTGALTVSAAPLTIRPDDLTMRLGATVPALTATYVGLVNGDTVSSLTTAPTLTTT